MIKEFRVKNFRCLEDVYLKLTPLHALVGPNDSGKSTIFRSIRYALTFLTSSYPQMSFIDKNLIYLEKNDQQPISAFFIKHNNQSILFNNNKEISIEHRYDSIAKYIQDNLEKFKTKIIRWEPDTLRQPSKLIPNGDPSNFFEKRGQGLPGIYDFILSRGDDSFKKISAEMCKLFPHMSRLKMIAVSDSQKNLLFELKNGQTIGVNEVSEGVLYFLAYSALQYIEPQDLLLIEEPENGLHPARIAEVMRILRDITTRGTQIILATHSPLVLNELKPEEITVLSRPEGKGTKATRLINVFNFKERAKVFSPGEMWLNYCNGIDEKPLLEGADINGKKE